jgi:hypothetical protein
VTEVTSGFFRGIYLLALTFSRHLRVLIEGNRAAIVKPGIPGHAKAKV